MSYLRARMHSETVADIACASDVAEITRGDYTTGLWHRVLVTGLQPVCAVCGEQIPRGKRMFQPEEGNDNRDRICTPCVAELTERV